MALCPLRLPLGWLSPLSSHSWRPKVFVSERKGDTEKVPEVAQPSCESDLTFRLTEASWSLRAVWLPHFAMYDAQPRFLCALHMGLLHPLCPWHVIIIHMYNAHPYFSLKKLGKKKSVHYTWQNTVFLANIAHSTDSRPSTQSILLWLGGHLGHSKSSGPCRVGLSWGRTPRAPGSCPHACAATRSAKFWTWYRARARRCPSSSCTCSSSSQTLTWTSGRGWQRSASPLPGSFRAKRLSTPTQV